MKKQIVISALLMLLSAPLFAGHVSETTAQRIAENFLKAKTHSKVEVALLEFEEKSDFPNFYVFGNEHCFVIVSADDCVHPILGYSTENGFGTRQMPENVKAWMQSYQDGIATAVANNYSATEEIAAQWSDLIEGKDLEVKSRNAVGPLIQTKWGQGLPYNMLCPETDGLRCVTGCVATAMAQVMKYWEFPSHGMGSHRYSSPYGELYACFGNTEYDWDNMQNEYIVSGEFTEEEMAVATLMYHCGVAVSMDYSPYISYAGSPIIALKQYFNYDLEYVEKENYSDDEWCELLINELENHRPIIYYGCGVSCHEFVCDGFDETGLFHFNWGWDGSDDGFYQIGALNPYNSYNNMNHALIGIKPAESSSSAPTDLSYSIDNRDVLLTWVAAENAHSYNVYFNNVLICNTTQTVFPFENTPSGNNEFYVRSVDEQGRSSLGTGCMFVNIDCSLLPSSFSFVGDYISECLTIEEGSVGLSEDYYYGDEGKSLCFDRYTSTSIVSITDLDCSIFDNGVEVSFQWFREYYGPTNASYLKIQYSLDNSTWADIGVVDCEGNNIWAKETFYIPELANAVSASLRFVYSSSGWYFGYMDDLEIKEAPPCFPPTKIDLISLSDVSAEITWSAGVASTEYTVAYGSSGMPIDEMTLISTNTNSCIIENLYPLTAYDLVVKANCTESGETEWSELFSFVTECSAALPLYYSFDDGDMPECIKLDGDYYVNGSYLRYGNPNGGSINSPDRPARVILQPVDMSNVNTGLEVNFKWHCNNNYLYVSENRVGYVVVQYSLDGNNWIDVDSPTYRFYQERVGVGGNETWMDQRINVPKIGNETKAYLSFLVTEPMYCPAIIALDEIEVKSVSFYSPTHVEIGNVTNASAVVSWSQNGVPNHWLVAYGLSGESVDEMETLLVDDTSMMIEGLQPGTHYDVYVKALYAEGEESGWSILNTFKTTSFVDFSSYLTFDDGQFPEGTEKEGPNMISITDELYYGDEGSCFQFCSDDGWHELGNRVVFPVSAQNASAGIRVEFMWYHYRTIFDYWHMNIDFVQVQYSLDGYNWINVGEEIDRWSDDENTFWTKEIITIPELANQPFAYVGIVFQGCYGCYGYIDNLIIKELNSIEEITQTNDLAEGWNWYTPMVKTNIASIQGALGDSIQLIQAEDGTPRGNVGPGQMLSIQTSAPCTLTLTGLSYTPATILIHHGENWFGYTDTEKTVAAAFAGFTPAEGDKVVSQDEGFAVYENGAWSGTLVNLQPGKGYVYISNATTSKTLVIGQ